MGMTQTAEIAIKSDEVMAGVVIRVEYWLSEDVLARAIQQCIEDGTVRGNEIPYSDRKRNSIKNAVRSLLKSNGVSDDWPEPSIRAKTLAVLIAAD